METKTSKLATRIGIRPFLNRVFSVMNEDIWLACVATTLDSLPLEVGSIASYMIYLDANRVYLYNTFTYYL